MSTVNQRRVHPTSDGYAHLEHLILAISRANSSLDLWASWTSSRCNRYQQHQSKQYQPAPNRRGRRQRAFRRAHRLSQKVPKNLVCGESVLCKFKKSRKKSRKFRDFLVKKNLQRTGVSIPAFDSFFFPVGNTPAICTTDGRICVPTSWVRLSPTLRHASSSHAHVHIRCSQVSSPA